MVLRMALNLTVEDRGCDETVRRRANVTAAAATHSQHRAAVLISELARLSSWAGPI
jgi:hypothetical protein